MRKNAGSMIISLLLLAVPALANAWTLTVKVAGGSTDNNVKVVYGSTTKILKSGTSYLYPSGTATVSFEGAAPATSTLDGISNAGPISLSSGSHTVAATYAAATMTGFNITQASGGVIYAQNMNNTWTTTGVSGLAAGTVRPVTIAADANHKIVSYSLDGGAPVSAGVTGAAGQVLSLSAAANGQTITASFGVAGKVSASLLAPTSGSTTKAVNCSVTATSNDTGLQYAFAVTGPAAFAQAASSNQSFSFTPAVAGTYTVTATVTSANGGSATASSSVVVADIQATTNSGCTSCHSTQSPTIVANYTASIHNQNTHSACSACHTSATPHSAGVNALNINTTTFVTSKQVTGPYGPVAAGVVFCTACHSGGYAPPHALTDKFVNCNSCHTANGAGDAHSIAKPTCVGCHSVARDAGAGYVQDNNGVRAITTEFAKWSHHVSGVNLQDAHCAACHLEGKAENGEIVVDGSKHMIDSVVHLRNADTDADLAWDRAAPNHSNMDNFCMSCHDANGATSAGSVAIQAVVVPAAGKTASAINPFGDTISNRYDKMQRPSVVDVSGQFNTTNNSHHAVKGPRYTGRSRAEGARQIASPATFANNSSAALYGKRSTIYDAGNFNSLYTPLENAGGETLPRTGAASLGDDSTLHCGDCHTVGQWKVGSSVNAAGQPTPVAIGAHGSNNEYMLRNSLGTDERHTQNAYTTLNGINTVTNPNGAFLVCFNCHAYNKYGSIFGATGAGGGHAGEYAQGGRCNGPGNTIPFNGYTTGTATDGTQFASRFEGPVTKYSAAASYLGEQNPDFGNVFGIQCANCHNSGVANGYGGIHGSKVNTYMDGMGNTNKTLRFLPGLGNTKYVPGTVGGITGGTTATGKYGDYTTGGVSNDTNWEQQKSQWNGTTSAWAGAGCYTLSETSTAATFEQKGLSVDGGATTPDVFGTWGGCDDHGAAPGGGDHGTFKKIVRPITY